MELTRIFERQFATSGEATYFAPGRVNLIGEHIDYNGGKVFPCAINLGTHAVVRKRVDRKLRFYSANMADTGIVELSLDDLSYRKEDGWANYPKGVLDSLAKMGLNLDVGFDIAYQGNIPNGSGLSSSASICVLTCWIVNDLYALGVDPIECARVVQRTENKYLGVSTGIMDQFAITMGKEKQAMLLDTSDLSFQYVPFDFEGTSLLIMNTCKRRELVDSAYNVRRNECDRALTVLQSVYEVNNLCEVTLPQLESMKDKMDDVIYRRARHAITENERTLKAVQVLTERDAKRFGELMNQSHASLKDDYEVTGIELDTLVHTAQKLDGVYGARVTGAGFGGCAIALVQTTQIPQVIETVRQQYVKTIGYEPAFYTVYPARGVHKVS